MHGCNSSAFNKPSSFLSYLKKISSSTVDSVMSAVPFFLNAAAEIPLFRASDGEIFVCPAEKLRVRLVYL